MSSLHVLKMLSRSQIRTTLKKKAFEDAGIPVRQVSSTASALPPAPATPQVAPHLSVLPQSVIGKNAEVQTFTNYSFFILHHYLVVVMSVLFWLVKFEFLFRKGFAHCMLR